MERGHASVDYAIKDCQRFGMSLVISYPPLPLAVLSKLKPHNETGRERMEECICVFVFLLLFFVLVLERGKKEWSLAEWRWDSAKD